MQNNRITVLIPVANAERTIRLALRSTLRALDSGCRILVYDDASTDSTVNRVHEAASMDERIGLIEGNSRVGIASALNILLSEAKTELVARMDGDDVVLPGRFRRQVREVSESGIDVTFTSRINFGSTWRNFRPYLPRRITPSVMPWMMLQKNPVPHSSMLARKRAILDVGGYRGSVAEDYDLWLRMLARGYRLSSLATPGIAYRLHTNQLTRTDDWLTRFEHDPLLRESYNGLANKLGLQGDAWLERNSGDEFKAYVAHGMKTLPPLDRLRAFSG